MSAYDLSGYGTRHDKKAVVTDLRLINVTPSNDVDGRATVIDFYGTPIGQTYATAHHHAYIRVSSVTGVDDSSSMQFAVSDASNIVTEVMRLTTGSVSLAVPLAIDYINASAAGFTFNVDTSTPLFISTTAAELNADLWFRSSTPKIASDNALGIEVNSTIVATLSSSLVKLGSGISLGADAKWYLKKGATAVMSIDDTVTIEPTATAFKVATSMNVVDSANATILATNATTGTITTNLTPSQFVVTDASSRLTTTNSLPSGSTFANPIFTGTISTGLTGSSIVTTASNGSLTATTTLMPITVNGAISINAASGTSRGVKIFGTNASNAGRVRIGSGINDDDSYVSSAIYPVFYEIAPFSTGNSQHKFYVSPTAGNALGVTPHSSFVQMIIGPGYVIPGPATDLGSSSARWAVLYASSLNVNGAITLNAFGTDAGYLTVNSSGVVSVTTSGLAAGNLTPATDNTYDLGSPSLRWKDLYVAGDVILSAFSSAGLVQTDVSGLVRMSNTLPANVVADSIAPISDSTGTIGTVSARFSYGYFAALDVSGDITQSGATTFATGTGSVTLNGSTTVVSGKTLTLAGLTTGLIMQTSTGGLVTASNTLPASVVAAQIAPASDGTGSIGSVSARFADGYYTNIDVSGTITGAAITSSGVVLAANGAISAPAYSFASDPTTGIYSTAGGTIRVSNAGSNTVIFGQSSITISTPIIQSVSVPSLSRLRWDSDVAITSSLRLYNNTTAITAAVGTQIQFSTSNSAENYVGANGLGQLILTSAGGAVIPAGTNAATTTLGTATDRWFDVFSKSLDLSDSAVGPLMTLVNTSTTAGTTGIDLTVSTAVNLTTSAIKVTSTAAFSTIGLDLVSGNNANSATVIRMGCGNTANNGTLTGTLTFVGGTTPLFTFSRGVAVTTTINATGAITGVGLNGGTGTITSSGTWTCSGVNGIVATASNAGSAGTRLTLANTGTSVNSTTKMVWTATPAAGGAVTSGSIIYSQLATNGGFKFAVIDAGIGSTVVPTIRLGNASATGGSGTSLTLEGYTTSLQTMTISYNGSAMFFTASTPTGSSFGPPTANNAMTFGTASTYCAGGWMNTAMVVVSDERVKDGIADEDLGIDFIRRLQPKSYRYVAKYIDHDAEGNEVIVPGVRRHHGFIAQQVKQVMDESKITDDDFAGYIYDKPADRYALRYEEFIAPMVKAMQEMITQNETLAAQNATLTANCESMQAQITALITLCGSMQTQINALTPRP